MQRLRKLFKPGWASHKALSALVNILGKKEGWSDGGHHVLDLPHGAVKAGLLLSQFLISMAVRSLETPMDTKSSDLVLRIYDPMG